MHLVPFLILPCNRTLQCSAAGEKGNLLIWAVTGGQTAALQWTHVFVIDTLTQLCYSKREDTQQAWFESAGCLSCVPTVGIPGPVEPMGDGLVLPIGCWP